VTTFLLASAVLAVAPLARHIALMTVAYLALRHSQPEQRSQILSALGPVLTAIHPPNRHDLLPKSVDMSPDGVTKIGGRVPT
jgi:hypothetical protein